MRVVIGPTLPPMLAPPAPFPAIASQAFSVEGVAPGMRRGSYRVVTSDGPLAIDVVAIDPSEPTVRLGTTIAHDRLISTGETVSSMAHRTGAVVGVNADYFDIGQTNQPLNVVVRGGTLVRTPSRRIVFDVRRDRSVHIENVTFSGTATFHGATIPLTAVNEYPPQGGAALITSDYGLLRPQPGVTLVSLARVNGVGNGIAGTGSGEHALAGTYRVTAVDESPMPEIGPKLALALGPAALALAAAPGIGETVTLAATTIPPIDDLATAVGGGPLLVQDGAVAVDPNAPAPEESGVRFPVSGAAVEADGTLLLISVDGRSPLSIGLTRPQFAALMIGLGARDGMAFDSGGSATLVARRLGEAEASVLNTPSDGDERPVADGLFAYSSAPIGPPTALVIRPRAIVALPGSRVPVTASAIDAAGHDLGAAVPIEGDAVDVGDVSRIAMLHAGRLVARVPIRVVTQLARLEIGSAARSVDPGEALALQATGYDDVGAPVALGANVAWKTDVGEIDASGRYLAANGDATVTAYAGGATATYRVRVGSHAANLSAFDGTEADSWTFAAAPRSGPGSVSVDATTRRLTLAYDFTSGERAAYANTSISLPGEPLRFAIDVLGDGSGIGVRAAFVNVLGERRALTLAKRVDWTGWRTLSLDLPSDLNPPVRLVSLYAVPTLGGLGARTSGTLEFRAPVVTDMGSQ